MARVKGALATRKRRKKTLKLARGYWGAKSKHFKMDILCEKLFGMGFLAGKTTMSRFKLF